ncbi:alpha-amylase family protein [Niabella hibiscisoli]|uniref:hypothetical protein n=1 Tax=Niabella hibiscisoli TaxID=1825928 RepID=UPI001F1136A0|nr:hypothetical protein [Niabella hibiscisoli]MCH5717961.1 hypothetical protein [Niabella hibiscisoli]
MRSNYFKLIPIVTVFLLLQGPQLAWSQTFKQWAQTPPMGWNSWDCYGPTVEEHEVKANADYMAKYLKPYGWEYVVVDIRWFVENDKAGAIIKQIPVIYWMRMVVTCLLSIAFHLLQMVKVLRRWPTMFIGRD